MDAYKNFQPKSWELFIFQEISNYYFSSQQMLFLRQLLLPMVVFSGLQTELRFVLTTQSCGTFSHFQMLFQKASTSWIDGGSFTVIVFAPSSLQNFFASVLKAYVQPCSAGRSYLSSQIDVFFALLLFPNKWYICYIIDIPLIREPSCSSVGASKPLQFLEIFSSIFLSREGFIDALLCTTQLVSVNIRGLSKFTLFTLMALFAHCLHYACTRKSFL